MKFDRKKEEFHTIHFRAHVFGAARDMINTTSPPMPISLSACSIDKTKSAKVFPTTFYGSLEQPLILPPLNKLDQ